MPNMALISEPPFFVEEAKLLRPRSSSMGVFHSRDEGPVVVATFAEQLHDKLLNVSAPRWLTTTELYYADKYPGKRAWEYTLTPTPPESPETSLTPPSSSSKRKAPESEKLTIMEDVIFDRGGDLSSNQTNSSAQQMLPKASTPVPLHISTKDRTIQIEGSLIDLRRGRGSSRREQRNQTKKSIEFSGGIRNERGHAMVTRSMSRKKLT